MSSEKAWIPQNSSLHVNEDGSLSIIPPKSWEYVGYRKEDGELLRMNRTTVSCTCNSSGTCTPFVAEAPPF